MAKTTSKENSGKKSANASSKKTSKQSPSTKLKSSQLMKLFVDELKDIYWAEKALTKAIPKMINNATSKKLIDALENHLEETEEQVTRVEEVFEILGKK